MDKTLKRKILYSKSSGVATPATAPPKLEKKVAVAKKEEKPILKHNAAVSVAEWVKSHKLFKWSGMCREMGIAPANFWRGITAETPVISEKHLPRIIQTLKQYGYAE